LSAPVGAIANKPNLLTGPIGGRCGERSKEEQSREEETEARQEEGNTRGFAVRVKRSARKAWRKQRSEEKSVTFYILLPASILEHALICSCCAIGRVQAAGFQIQWAAPAI
jgi:hypothetical protein